MDLTSFRSDFLNEIKSYAITNMCSDREAFFDYACNYIVETGEILEFNPSYYEGKGRNGKKIQLDGYYFDKFTRELNLIICDYRTNFDSRELGIPQIRKLVQDAVAFIENRELLEKHLEESSLAYQFIDWLKYLWKEITKVRVIILSTEKTKKIKKVEKFELEGRMIYYNVWGIERFQELLTSPTSSANITINLLEYSENGIPALYASSAKVKDYESYLAVIPGSVLADLYDSYGAKLLEGNVRSFLSYRGKVNKAIRGTLIGRPHMFFAFNNGISATAAGLETHIVNGNLYIKSLTDFQIVNGGQTTASIFNVKHVRKEADLIGVYVPMKLNVISDEERAEKLIPIIAETANTQNKVNKADFFANSSFHRRIEQISLILTAPAIEGNQYGTKWFYERARGSYEARLLSFKTSNTKRDHFKLTHPKNQKVTKTDFAKYFNSLNYKPYHVSKGAQRNFIEFARDMDVFWKKNNDFINEDFYKTVIVGGILFKSLERLVSSSNWYQNAFRANIVTYSISYFFKKVLDIKDYSFNFDIIWNYQKVPEELLEIFNTITYEVFLEITAEHSHRTRNVTEWCKKEDCWKEMIVNIKYDFPEEVEQLLQHKSVTIKKEKEAAKEQKLVTKLNKQIEVVRLGENFWRKVLEYGEAKKKLFAKEHDLIKLASRMESSGKVPSEKQSILILNILDKMKLEGFNLD